MTAQQASVTLIHTQYRRRGGMEQHLLDIIAGLYQLNVPCTLCVLKRDPALTPPPNTEVLHIKTPAWLYQPARLRLFDRKIAAYLQQEQKNDPYRQFWSLTRTTGQDISICGGTHLGYFMATKRRIHGKARREIAREQRSYDNAKFIISHSPMLSQELQKYYHIPPEKIVNLYPPNSATRGSWQTQAARRHARAELGYTDAHQIFAFPASGHLAEKGLDMIYAALQAINRPNVVILHAGTPTNSARFSHPQIRHLGFLGNISKLYAAADATLLPSHYDAFGMVITESLIHGTPVIVSDRVGSAPLIAPGEGTVLPEFTPAALAAAMHPNHLAQLKVTPGFAERHPLDVVTYCQKLLALGCKP